MESSECKKMTHSVSRNAAASWLSETSLSESRCGLQALGAGLWRAVTRVRRAGSEVRIIDSRRPASDCVAMRAGAMPPCLDASGRFV
ncbi:hypothetical protein Rmet_5709 (plasmid) [Cupriavidus metallidurans CH34]|uniref:Uncharacterized protein n=1 Tax=Cupriavidus metallidurans (strain ATCC 43123 / DSM 2839 / NBRC 102507 / CH34) TaxID=266264 RepID=Q1LBA8_CUPMC|nr:hypothetical protein Rmet_5709 [Cupriavidus metallidurans CH34]